MNKDTEVWQGTSLDEWDRMKDSRQNWYRHVYPFIEIIPMNRNQCVAQIQKFGWSIPNKSRCWMCPNQSQEAWKQVKKLSNGGFEKAVELEKTVRQKDSDLYFHKLRLPLLVAVDQGEMQLDLFDGCDSGYCFT